MAPLHVFVCFIILAAPAAMAMGSCAPGQATLGGGNCVNCTPGTYTDQNSLGQSYCNNCSVGRFASAAVSTGCTNCAAGTYSNRTGATVCATCSNGTSNAGQDYQCTACPAGQYATSGSTCAACDVGHFSAGGGVSACTACAAGYIAPSTATIACYACQAGSFASAAGSSVCTKCPEGYGSGPAAAVCVNGTSSPSAAPTAAPTAAVPPPPGVITAAPIAVSVNATTPATVIVGARAAGGVAVTLAVASGSGSATVQPLTPAELAAATVGCIDTTAWRAASGFLLTTTDTFSLAFDQTTAPYAAPIGSRRIAACIHAAAKTKANGDLALATNVAAPCARSLVGTEMTDSTIKLAATCGTATYVLLEDVTVPLSCDAGTYDCQCDSTSKLRDTTFTTVLSIGMIFIMFATLADVVKLAIRLNLFALLFNIIRFPVAMCCFAARAVAPAGNGTSTDEAIGLVQDIGEGVSGDDAGDSSATKERDFGWKVRVATTWLFVTAGVILTTVACTFLLRVRQNDPFTDKGDNAFLHDFYAYFNTDTAWDLGIWIYVVVLGIVTLITQTYLRRMMTEGAHRDSISDASEDKTAAKYRFYEIVYVIIAAFWVILLLPITMQSPIAYASALLVVPFLYALTTLYLAFKYDGYRWYALGWSLCILFVELWFTYVAMSLPCGSHFKYANQ